MLLCILVGARVGGIGLGVFGGLGLAILSFGFGLKPAGLPIDVMFMIMAVVDPQDSEYGTVYINGDHNIATVWENENGVSGRLKIRQIESEFMALMFGEA